MAPFIELQLLSHWERTTTVGYIYILAGRRTLYVGQSSRGGGGVTGRYLEHLVEIYRDRPLHAQSKKKLKLFQKEAREDIGAWIVKTVTGTGNGLKTKLDRTEAALILGLALRGPNSLTLLHGPCE